ncbi:Uncharacterised protein [Enterobacter cloacae]|nr:Uncharacterised protein [Enterobacter cloacae]
MVLSSHRLKSGAVSSLCHLRIMVALRVAEAALNVVIDQPAGLHKGVTDGGAHKLKAAFFQCF